MLALAQPWLRLTYMISIRVGVGDDISKWGFSDPGALCDSPVLKCAHKCFVLLMSLRVHPRIYVSDNAYILETTHLFRHTLALSQLALQNRSVYGGRFLVYTNFIHATRTQDWGLPFSAWEKDQSHFRQSTGAAGGNNKGAKESKDWAEDFVQLRK